MGYFSVAGAVPAELPISCDLRRFVQSENAGIIVLLALRKPNMNQGTTSCSTRALLKPPPGVPCLETDAPINCISALPAARVIAGDDLGRLHWLEIVD
jgi:hypothetical protein